MQADIRCTAVVGWTVQQQWCRQVIGGVLGVIVFKGVLGVIVFKGVLGVIVFKGVLGVIVPVLLCECHSKSVIELTMCWVSLCERYNVISLPIC